MGCLMYPMMIKINLMKNELELELLLPFDGASYQATDGYVVEFTVRRTDKTAERPMA